MTEHLSKSGESRHIQKTLTMRCYLLKRFAIAVFAAAVLLCMPSAHAAVSYTLVTEPDEGMTSIYNFLGQATHTIDMTMYELSDTTFEQDLAAAASRGVTVRVILDQNNEKSANTAAYNYLTSNGVSVHWANPTYAVTHQKTITIDGAYSDAQTAIMTLNLTPQYYSTTRDFALIENDVNDIAAIETTFNADFVNGTITPPTGDDLVWSPTNSQTLMVGLINSAKQTLLVENEEMSDTAIVNALEAAAERGVTVQIAMTNTSNDYETEFNALVKAGCYVSTYVSTASLYIHAKIMVADYGTASEQFYLGSENFSSASLTKNRELGIITNDSTTLASLDDTLTSDFDGGTPWPGSGGSGANFSLSASPSTLTIAQGANGSSTITVTPTNGFTGSVALSASGLPSGVTASFNPSSTTTTSVLTMTASSTATTGTSTVTITGTSGSLTHTTTISLTVTAAAQPSFTLSASPSTLSLTQGTNGTSTITVTPSGGFSGTVALSATGLPSGVTAAFNPTSTTSTSVLTFTASSTATTGTTTVTVTGVSGSITKTTTISLTIVSSGGGATQLLLNPGFESGNVSWTALTGVINDSGTEPPHSGLWDAWLDGKGKSETETLAQTVAIPSGKTTATLTFWLHIDTAETTTTKKYDTMKVELLNSKGKVLATLGTFTNLNHNTGYVLESYSLTSYIGQTVEVYLTGTEDSEYQTSFVVDDFALNVQ